MAENQNWPKFCLSDKRSSFGHFSAKFWPKNWKRKRSMYFGRKKLILPLSTSFGRKYSFFGRNYSFRTKEAKIFRPCWCSSISAKRPKERPFGRSLFWSSKHAEFPISMILNGDRYKTDSEVADFCLRFKPLPPPQVARAPPLPSGHP